MFYPLGKKNQKNLMGEGGRDIHHPPPLVRPRVYSRSRISNSNAMRTLDPRLYIILGAMSDIYEPDSDKNRPFCIWCRKFVYVVNKKTNLAWCEHDEKFWLIFRFNRRRA